MKHKAEIISQVLRDLPDGKDGGVACSDAYRAHVTETLRAGLPDGFIQTCEDFKNVRVECCRGCHDFDSEQLCLEALPDGRSAWICCAVRRSEEHTSELQSPMYLVCR